MEKGQSQVLALVCISLVLRGVPFGAGCVFFKRPVLIHFVFLAQAYVYCNEVFIYFPVVKRLDLTTDIAHS